MKFKASFIILMSLMTISSVFAEDIISGPQIGGNVPAYQLYDVTGANAGKNTCYT